MIMITGGAGFIGSMLALELNKSGRDDLIIVDRLEASEKWLNLRAIKFKKYIHADDLFFEDINAFEGVEMIYHMGACSDTTELDMDYLMKNNVEYSQKLFLIATEKDVPIIYASSAATYGAGEQGYSDDPRLIKNLKPLNRYGYSKQLFDEWVLRRERHPGHWFGVKFFNVFGPHEDHKGEMKSLVQKAYHQIKEDGRVKLFRSHKEGFKDGEQLRDFIYVKDCVRAMIRLSDPTVKSESGIYNLGTGVARSFYDLVVATFQAMGVEPAVDFIDMPLKLRGQYQYFTQAQMERFHKTLPGFQFTDLETAVKDYVQEHLMKGE